MANQSVLELAVGTGKWDAGLKKAQQSLNNFTQAQGGLQQALAKDNGDIQKFVQMMAKMDSTANTAKGQMNDYKRSIEQLSAAYNQMSSAQQASIGQEYLKTIDALKQKFQDAKQQCDELNRSLNGIGDLKLPESKGGSMFGGLTDMLSVAGGNLIASGISKLTSELTETVQQSIELARSGEGVRLAFDRLNQPGLLNNLKEATHGTVSELELMKAAVKFDDFKLPVEQLGTLLAFAQKKAKDTGQSVDYMVDSIVTGLGRKSLMILDNLGLSAAQIKDRMAETGDMTTAVASIIKEQMSEAGEYVETAADRAARAAADAQNQMEELGRKAMPVAEELGKAWNQIKISGMEVLTFVLTPIAESLKDIREILSGEYELKIKADIPNYADDDGKTVWSGWKPGTDHTVQAPGGYVEVTDKNTGAVIGGQHFDNLNDANSIKDWQKTLFKTPKTGGKSKTPTAADFNKFIAKSMLGAEDLKEDDAKNFLSPYQMMLPDIKKHILDIKDADLGDSLAKLGEKKVTNEIAERTKMLDQQSKAMNYAAQAASNFGAALAGIEDPSAKAAGTVISAIANVALGFSQAASQASSMGPYGWLAYLAAGTAAMATTISTIHSLTGYANGGEIKGNSYSGDNLTAMGPSGLIGLNAGEIILNRAQQSNVASGLQGAGSLRGLNLRTKVKGTELLVWLDNSLAQSGRGELVTWGQ